MSKTYLFSHDPMSPADASTFTSLFSLLDMVAGKIDGEEKEQLLDDLLHFCPPAPEPGPCLGSSKNPPYFDRAHLLDFTRSGAGDPFAPAAFQDVSQSEIKFSSFSALRQTFAGLEEDYPLRGAALSLRILARIWVELVEGKKLHIMRDNNFLNLYLDAMLQVEAQASRCEYCSRPENVIAL